MKKILLALGLILVLTVLTVLNVYAAPPDPVVVSGECRGVKFKLGWLKPAGIITKYTVYFTVNSVFIKAQDVVKAPYKDNMVYIVIGVDLDCKVENNIQVQVASTNNLGEESIKSNIIPLKTTWIEGTGL